MATSTPATVHFQFPLWAIGLPSVKVKGLMRVADPTGAKGIALFTDESLATAFLNGNPRLAGNVLRAIMDPVHLFGLLTAVEKAGFANVVIDPDPAPAGVSTGTCYAFLVSDLLSDLERLLL
jgi:hypothetical protein